jgi:hypothetical protein
MNQMKIESAGCARFFYKVNPSSHASYWRWRQKRKKSRRLKDLHPKVSSPVSGNFPLKKPRCNRFLHVSPLPKKTKKKKNEQPNECETIDPHPVNNYSTITKERKKRG